MYYIDTTWCFSPGVVGQIGNRSSSYCSESSVRRDGSYIYEEFLATDGVDVKVYTVGPDYAHAEARKCPVSDSHLPSDEFQYQNNSPYSTIETEIA